MSKKAKKSNTTKKQTAKVEPVVEQEEVTQEEVVATETQTEEVVTVEDIPEEEVVGEEPDLEEEVVTEEPSSAVDAPEDIPKVQVEEEAPVVEAVPAENAYVSRVRRYVVDMMPNKVQTSESIVRNQRMLLQTLDGILRLEGTDFVAAWKEVVTIVRENRRSVFVEYMSMRGLDQIADGHTRNRLSALINLLTATADTKGGYSEVSKVVSFSVFTSKNLLTADELNKLESIYA